LGEGLLDQLANGVFHGVLFSTASAVERFDAQVEKLGIIRCRERVANLCQGSGCQ
jgi:hypothetical protein